ncbi:Zinc finger, DksA/TraR C4-type [Syntrophomonas zehnderi OL-4]|uniref:Zinc finger, DksA/TraR C4-type n=1 Tax=Syntrophomonas zehnderi OL-4 TaxID=690567 RepID=A0A0E3W2U0_9FIRM|nr:FmdE family protein [Syntrophomonas zehnderi]CFX19287.1 Zinc finger, DksA/TraR C4-type [Syntrophomonas zehnderi OL-4]
MSVKNDWEKAVDFHGHSCVGLAIGFRAGQIALERLNSSRAPDEELIAIVETDNCALDSLQVLLGCSMGKGNIFFRDYGKNVFTIGRRDTGRAVRIAAKSLDHILDDEFGPLRTRVFNGTASEQELNAFQKLMAEETRRILTLTEEELFTIEAVDLDFPSQARIFPSLTCSVCGEQVMEPRARMRDGKPVCIPCSDYYPARI